MAASAWLDATVEEPFLVLKRPVSRKNDLAKVLELVRLKSNSVKLAETSTKYKLNLNICAYMAKYLQRFVDESVYLSRTDDFGQTNYSPKQKQVYLRLYLTRYWNFVCRQAIKLKQIENVNLTVNADLSTTIIDNSELNDSMNQSISSNFNNLRVSDSKIYQDFFSPFYENNSNENSYYPQVLINVAPSSRRSTLLANTSHNNGISMSQGLIDVNNWDALTQTGLLNLIYLNLIADSVDDCENTSIVQRLDEAICLFNLMDSCLSGRAKNELNKNQLEVSGCLEFLLVNKKNFDPCLQC